MIEEFLKDVETIDFNNEEQYFKHKDNVTEVMKHYATLNEKEVRYIITYFTKLNLYFTNLNVPFHFIPRTEELKNSIAYYEDNESTRGIYYINENMVLPSINSGENFEIRSDNIFSSIHTIAHETTHGIHAKNYKKTNITDVTAISPFTILYAKEEITNRFNRQFLSDRQDTKTDVSNYKFNYENMLFEQDANLVGFDKTLKWIYEYCPKDVISKFEYNEYNSGLREIINFNKEHPEEVMQKNIHSKKDEKTFSKISVITSYVVKKHTKRIFDEYPIMKLIYNYDGTKKDYEKIKKEYEENLEMFDKLGITDERLPINGRSVLRRNNLDNIFKMIVKSDPVLNIANKIDQMMKVSDTVKDRKIVDIKTDLLLSDTVAILVDLEPEFYDEFKTLIEKEKEKIINARSTEYREYMEVFNKTEGMKRSMVAWYEKDNIFDKKLKNVEKIYNFAYKGNPDFKKSEDEIKAKEENNLRKREENLRISESIVKEKFGLNEIETKIWEYTNFVHIRENTELKNYMYRQINEELKEIESKKDDGTIDLFEADKQIFEIDKVRKAIFTVFNQNTTKNVDQKKSESLEIKIAKLKDSIQLLETIFYTNQAYIEKNVSLLEFKKLYELWESESQKIISLFEEYEKEHYIDSIVIPYKTCETSDKKYVTGFKTVEELKAEKQKFLEENPSKTLPAGVFDKYITIIESLEIKDTTPIIPMSM